MCDHCGCRDLSQIAELTGEHQAILDLAWRCAEDSRSAAERNPATANSLRLLLEDHVAKEEAGLYPLLVLRGYPRPELKGLEDEHREIHRRLECGEFDRYAFYYLAAHIEVEETELFPRALFSFEEEDWSAMDDVSRTVEPSNAGPSQGPSAWPAES